jgi:hypothetical protein
MMNRLAAALLIALPLSLFAQNPVFTTPTKNVVAKVSIMAISTTIHQAFAGNQETYLADVSLKDGHQTARLIDLYSGNGDPIRRSLLTDRKQFVMHLVRQPSCDIASNHFFLDRSDYNVFDTASRLALSQTPDAILPCYLIVHDKTRIAKN